MSSVLPSVQKLLPYTVWLWAAAMTSGRASWMALWIMKAAVLSSLQSPPSTTLPSWLTRIRSEALMSANATPNGFTQNVSGSTGSRSVMWPATPSSKPYCGWTRSRSAVKVEMWAVHDGVRE